MAPCRGFGYNVSFQSPQMTTDPKVSFIIPVYNEQFNIPNVLRDLYEVIHQNPDWNAEVIVIEDGSTDHTRNVLLGEVKKYPGVQLIFHDRNLGYPPSLKGGINRSRGRYLMYIGADEEFDCSEVPSFVNLLLASNPHHADFVLGVRWQRNAYKLHRFFLSVIYIFLLNFLFKLRVNDYNWSQAWPRELLEKIELRSRSLFVLPEIIVRAYDLNYVVKEVPSNHRGRRTGKSSVNLKKMGAALLEAFRFWRYRNSPEYSPLK